MLRLQHWALFVLGDSLGPVGPIHLLGPVGPSRGFIWALLGPFICWALLGPFICSTRNKSQMAPNEKVCVYEKLGLRSKHRVKVIFEMKKCVFAESMEERGSMYEHFPLCGSARGTIWGRLVKKEFSNKNRFSENVTFWILFELFRSVVLGVSEEISVSL